MPLANPRQDPVPLPVQPAPRVSVTADGAATIPSPARVLQDRLERHAQIAVGRDLGKWSPRRTLAFIVAASAALWMAIIAGAAEAVHMVA